MGVSWGMPQAASSTMTARRPGAPDRDRLAVLELTGFTCSRPASLATWLVIEEHHPNLWLIVLQNCSPVNTGEFGDDGCPEVTSEPWFHDRIDLRLPDVQAAETWQRHSNALEIRDAVNHQG